MSSRATKPNPADASARTVEAIAAAPDAHNDDAPVGFFFNRLALQRHDCDSAGRDWSATALPPGLGHFVREVDLNMHAVRAIARVLQADVDTHMDPASMRLGGYLCDGLLTALRQLTEQTHLMCDDLAQRYPEIQP